MMKWLFSCWKALTYDEGVFSTKRTAYTLSVIVTTYIVFKIGAEIRWEVLAAYMAHCTGPTTFREYLKMRSGQTSTVEDDDSINNDTKKEDAKDELPDGIKP